MKNILILSIFITVNISGQNVNKVNTPISFKEYKEFIFYVRDSIAREILAEMLEDYSTDIFPGDERNFQLNWRIKINLKYDEIVDGLKYADFMIGDKNNYYINLDKLSYANNRNSETGVSIYPDVKEWDILLGIQFDNNLTFKNNWNKKYDDFNIPNLTVEQINAYVDWDIRNNTSNLRKCCSGYKIYSNH